MAGYVGAMLIALVSSLWYRIGHRCEYPRAVLGSSVMMMSASPIALLSLLGDSHHHALTWLFVLPPTVLLLAAVVVAVRYWLLHRAAIREREWHLDRLVLLAREYERVPGVLLLEEPTGLLAYSLPGGPTVLSSTLVDRLSPWAVDAIIEHERAHHRASHHRVKLLAQAIRPVAPSVSARLRDSLELEADCIARREPGGTGIDAVIRHPRLRHLVDPARFLQPLRRSHRHRTGILRLPSLLRISTLVVVAALMAQTSALCAP